MRCEDEDFIQVRTVDGKIYKVAKESAQTFKELKEKVAELSGIPINKQIIVANVQIVKDDALLLEPFTAENSSFILATKLQEKKEGDVPPSQQTRKKQNPSNQQKQKPFASNTMPVEMGYNFNTNSIQTHQIEAFMALTHQDIQFMPFSSADLQRKLRKNYESKVDQDVVIDLVEMGVEKEMAVRACRAAKNNKSQAWELIELQNKGESYVISELQNPPKKTIEDEQIYLVDQLKKTISFNRRFDQGEFILTVASYKERYPPLYELFMRNYPFVVSLIEKYFTPRQEIVPNNSYRHNRAGFSSQIAFPKEMKEQFKNYFNFAGYSDEKVKKALRETENDISKAKLLLLQEKKYVNKVTCPSFLFEKQREYYLLSAFLTSPAWNALRTRLKGNFSIEKAQFLLNLIRKYLPFSQKYKIYSWLIYPTIFQVEYYQVNSMAPLLDIQVNHHLRKLSNEEKIKRKQYYQQLVDRQLLQVFVKLGTNKELAEQALRASCNNAYQAITWALMGGVASGFNCHNLSTDLQLQKLLFSKTQYFIRCVCDQTEFDLIVASFKCTDPALYLALTSFGQVRQYFKQFSLDHKQCCANQQQWRSFYRSYFLNLAKCNHTLFQIYVFLKLHKIQSDFTHDSLP